MAVFFRCVCSVVETFEQEPYERRLQQLNDIRTFLREGKLREAALIVRDVSNHAGDYRCLCSTANNFLFIIFKQTAFTM